jgi:multidrug resistance efflux pump
MRIRLIAATLAGACFLAALAVPFSRAQDGADAGGAAAAAAQAATTKTIRVETAPFKVENSLDGVFESPDAVELQLRPEAWQTFKVEKAVEHGAVVRKGDKLITLDLEEIDKAITEQMATVELSEIELKVARMEHEFLESSFPSEMANAELAARIAKESAEEYESLLKPYGEKSRDLNLRQSEDYLESEQEELRQLEKMYKADDLTEETEEIILKRQRRSVEQAMHYLEGARMRYTLDKKHDVRNDHNQKESLRQAMINYERATGTLPLGVARGKLNLERTRRSHDQAVLQLKKLKKDREAMDSLVAPIDGVVYFGKASRGSFASINPLSAGDALQPGQVFITVVNPRQLFVRLSVAEKDLDAIRQGVTGSAVPTAFSQLRIPVRIDAVGNAPITGGLYDCRTTVVVADSNSGLMPGMTCKVTLITYQAAAAISLPNAALFADEDDAEKSFVYVRKADGGAEKRTVKVGRKTEKKTEIVDGLKTGEEVFTEKPSGV